MMKKLLQHIILPIAILAVLLTGTGVTVMDYCCTGCISEVLENGTEGHSCNSTKPLAQNHHQTSDDSDCCDSSVPTIKGEHCGGSSRLSIDLDSTFFKPQIGSSFVWLSDIIELPFQQQAQGVKVCNIARQSNAPPIIPPREYLSALSILII